MPASPMTATMAPSEPRIVSWAARMVASAPSRPTSGRSATGPSPIGSAGARVATGDVASPSRIASYRAVVVTSGATPSSRSRTATQARYWRSAAERSPAATSRSMSRTWPASSSGSRASRRSVASIAVARSPSASVTVASRSRTSSTLRSAATARVARQSSNSGLSRRLKPARNPPRTSAAAAARASRSCAAAADSIDVRSTDTRRRSRSTRPRSISSGPSPMAARRVDRVRRSAPWRRPRRSPAKGSPPARRGHTDGHPPRATRGSPRPCECPRRAGDHRRTPRAGRGVGSRDAVRRDVAWTRRNGTHSVHRLVTFR